MRLAWPSPSGRGGKAGPLKGRIFGVAALLALAIVGAWLWTSLQARDAQIAETKAKVLNLANSVAQHAERSIEAADIVMRNIIDRLEVADLATTGKDRMRLLMIRRGAELE